MDFGFGLPLPDLGDEEPEIEEPDMEPAMLTLSILCDPSRTFTARTPKGYTYDSMNPIYNTKTCTLFVGKGVGGFFALKTSRILRILEHEWEMYRIVGTFPTIIQAQDYWTIGGVGFIEMEFAFGGSLSSVTSYLSLRDAWRVLAHISLALTRIHACGLIHLDISPANILQTDGLADETVYKLADFGTVIPYGDFNEFCEGAGPYVSPEALAWPNTPNTVSYPTDIWSLGAVMYEIVTKKKMPRDNEGYQAIRNGTYDLSLIPDEFDIIRAMLSPDPKERPTAEELVSLPVVHDIIMNVEAELAVSKKRIANFMMNVDSTCLNRRRSFDRI